MLCRAHNDLGNTFALRGQLEQAVDCYRQALLLQPSYAEAHNNLGNALMAQGRLPEALSSFQQALSLHPDNAEAHYNLGNALGEQAKRAEAIASYRQALRLKPDHAAAHKNLGMTLLLLGNLEQGWPEYEWRPREQRSVPILRHPLWDGAPLAGQTILLHAEQGLGDTLQFIRYAPLVKERGGRVVVVCAATLVRLLGSCPGIDRLIPLDRPLPPFDVQAPLMSLPGIFGTTLATVPARAPYLSAQAEQIDRWRQELSASTPFKIGIAWQGNPRNPYDPYKSFRLECFAPLARLEGVQLFSLQKGPGSEQLAAAAGAVPVTDLGPRLADFADTAAYAHVRLDPVFEVSTCGEPTCAGPRAYLGLGACLCPIGLEWAASCWNREDSPCIRRCVCSAKAGRARGRTSSRAWPAR